MTIEGFSQLVIGNWWVYSALQLDSLGDYRPMGTGRDTVRINRDTIINGKTFFVAEGTYHGGSIPVREYWRDSADCLVNEIGHILFCFGHFNSIFQVDSIPGQFTANYVTSNQYSSVGTALGTLNCYIMTVTYNYVLYGQRDWHYKYTYKIGRVKWDEDDPAMFYPIEQRLVNYFVQ